MKIYKKYVCNTICWYKKVAKSGLLHSCKMLRAKFHISSKHNSMLKIITSCLAMCLILACKGITLFNHNNQFSMNFFSWFSYRQTPPVSDHFVVQPEWSLTSELTVLLQCLVRFSETTQTSAYPSKVRCQKLKIIHLPFRRYELNLINSY